MSKLSLQCSYCGHLWEADPKQHAQEQIIYKGETPKEATIPFRLTCPNCDKQNIFDIPPEALNE